MFSHSIGILPDFLLFLFRVEGALSTKNSCARDAAHGVGKKSGPPPQAHWTAWYDGQASSTHKKGKQENTGLISQWVTPQFECCNLLFCCLSPLDYPMVH